MSGTGGMAVENDGAFLGDFGVHSASETAPLSTLATAMMFGTIVFAAAGLAARSFLTGDLRSFRAALNPRASPLDVRSYASVYTLLHHSTVFGLILLFAYICEYHPPFPHANKSYDRDEFFFMTAVLILASSYTVSKNDKSSAKKKPNKSHSELNGHSDDGSGSSVSTDKRTVAESNPHNEVLNRDQTEEWKGWMQYMFLLYHYYHAEEVYNSIRIMITCYVWMTGFGNFSFFYLKADYSSIRVMQMLWRLNFLVIFLCLSQGTTYILYYICLLHTYFFLMVYVAMRVGKHLNYTRYGLRLKMAVVAFIIFLLWDVDTGLFQLVHMPFLGQTPMMGANAGSMWEWYFRSSLDHWSTFFGMVFALNFPITSLFFRKLEAQPPLLHFLGKASVAVALLGSLYVWVTGPFSQPKLEYNATNAYYGFIPLITYIYLRNLTPTLRSYSLDLLHQIGKTTLETYLMQHHIWLTSDAKSLLTLVPGWPKMNMLVVTFIYYYVSRRLYRLTLFLRGMLLPDDRNKCIRSFCVIAGTIASYYAIALTLNSLGMLSLTSVAIIAFVGGMLLYQTIMDTTWQAYRDSASSNPSNSSDASIISNGSAKADHDSPVSSSAPPIIGAMVVLILGLTWHGMARVGAAKIKPLPSGCEAFVNDGQWIPVDGCNQESRGVGYRDYGISSYATCSSKTYAWGWNNTQSSSHCRFVRRDAKTMRKALNHRNIAFVGDSMTRNLYQATLRAMGIAGAGAYNTKLPKWSDMSYTVGDTKVEFQWAALATDQVTKLKDLTARPAVATTADESVRPDLVVVGGGAWDRLHVYATDEDQASHRSTVKGLAKEIGLARSAGMPVAWMIPTTINSDALQTEEKQKNIKEEDMEAMRALYASLGVLSSSSFVLDGPGFTASRVAESYDGVHYPMQVYDAGAQILANSMDWLLPKREFQDKLVPPQPGKMANPLLGLMMLCFVFMGLMFFDGFMGFSYLASLFVTGVMPSDLYEEAFTALHRKNKLPEIKNSQPYCASRRSENGGHSEARNGNGNLVRRNSPSTSPSTVDEEIAALLGNDDIEMSMKK